jgi:hypothetical protein
MTKIIINYEVELDDQFIEDLIVTAFEGGSNYWVDHVIINHPDGDKPKGEPGSTWAASALNSGGNIVVFTQEEADSHDFPPITMTKEMLVKGVQMWAKEFPERVSIDNGSIDMGNTDADDADAIFQYALFDEVVFG